MGPRDCAAHCLGTQIRQECTEYPGQIRPLTGSALQIGKAMGCALCSSPTLSRAVGWATQLPMCSGKVL